jgi:hypothetical protein
LDGVALLGIDLTRCELPVWGSRFSQIAVTEQSALDQLRKLHAEMERRFNFMAETDLRILTKTRGSAAGVDDRFPPIVLIVENAEHLWRDSRDDLRTPEGQALLRRLLSRGAPAGIVVTAGAAAYGTPQFLYDFPRRIAYGTDSASMTDRILGAGRSGRCWDAHMLGSPTQGTQPLCYVLDENEPERPEAIKSFLVSEETAARVGEQTAHLRPELDWLDEGIAR